MGTDSSSDSGTNSLRLFGGSEELIDGLCQGVGSGGSSRHVSVFVFVLCCFFIEDNIQHCVIVGPFIFNGKE